MDSNNLPLLEIKDLKKSYENTQVLDNLSFEVHPQEVIGLLGANGAGKSTVFYIIIGLIRPDQGKVFFKGHDVTLLPIHRRARLGMGYLAQEPSLFLSLTVEENISCVLEVMPLSREERKERLYSLLEELDLYKLAKKKAAHLSGGERRRLEITRTLASKPSLLLLDEPFANIDPITVNEVKRMIRLLQNKGISILITDHNAREIFTIVDRSYLIQAGKILAAGSKEQLLQDPEARLSYFGNDF